jgi:hypothetical protein
VRSVVIIRTKGGIVFSTEGISKGALGTDIAFTREVLRIFAVRDECGGDLVVDGDKFTYTMDTDSVSRGSVLQSRLTQLFSSNTMTQRSKFYEKDEPDKLKEKFVPVAAAMRILENLAAVPHRIKPRLPPAVVNAASSGSRRRCLMSPPRSRP